MDKERWEKYKQSFNEEELNLANMIELVVDREYQKGKTIDRNLVRNVVVNTNYTRRLYKIVDYLVNKYRT